MKTDLRGARRMQGFTLVELLVAISMLALLTVLGWRGLDGIVRARVALTAELEHTRAMQLTFSQLQSDCGQLASSALLGKRAPLLLQKDRLMLVRTIFAEHQPPRLQVVDYHLRNGMLTRRESAQTRDLNELDSWWSMQRANPDSTLQAAQPVLLQADLGSMQIRLWGRGDSAWRSVAASAALASADSVTPTTPVWSGLELSLQTQTAQAAVPQATTTVVKAFLLGGA